MDKEFQTSFVPKKTIQEREPKRSGGSFGGIINLLALIVFIASLVGAGGVYFYRSSLESTIEGYKESLARARAAFEPTLITKLQVLDKRMRAATGILGKHIAVSPIFSLLGETTLPTVRYSDFAYEFNKQNVNLVDIKITGQAKGYNQIALQADLFAQNKFIKNPIFSNFTLDQQGNIAFNLTFSVDKSLVVYESFLERQQSLGPDGEPIVPEATSPMTVTPIPDGTSIPPVTNPSAGPNPN
jgi:hypothetical protein